MADYNLDDPAAVPFYSLLQIQTVTGVPEDKAELNVFSDYTLFIAAEGGGWAETDKGRFVLDKGKGFLLKPGNGCRIQAEEQGLELYRLDFTVAGGQGIGNWENRQQEELLNSGPVSCRPYSQCALLLDAIVNSCRSLEAIERFAGHVRFQELLLLLMRANPAAAKNRDEHEGVQRSISYMQEHYYETINVEQLAEIAGIGRTRYTQLFKTITQQNPLEYLNRLRIERAQQQLLLTKDRLHEIALAVGYSNEYYFNRRFKGTVGVTPGQYRSIYQEGARVFAPFLEDYLLALGVIPVAQYCHPKWGKQDYLGLQQVPAFDIAGGDWQELSHYSPEFIMLDDGFQRWHLEKCGAVAPLFKLPFHQEDWRATLRTAAAILGRTDRVREVITEYEHMAEQARSQLNRSVRQQTVAFLRISAAGIALYGCEELGFTGGVLHKDLGLNPHPLVRKLTRGQKRAGLTADELSQLHADHLFITFDRQEGEGRELLETGLWRSLPAARSGNVYEMDFMAWMNYGVLSHRRKIKDVLSVLA